MQLSQGQRVTVRGHTGTIRFFGPTKFATGDWVGIELETPQGRNDGSVQGVRYFECKAPGNYGIFVKPELLEDSSHDVQSSYVTNIVNKLQSKLKNAVEEIAKYRSAVTQLETEIANCKVLREELEASLEKATINEEHLQSCNTILNDKLKKIKSEFEELSHDHSLLREELDLHKDLEEAIKGQQVDDAITKEDFVVLVQNNKRLEAAILSAKRVSDETESRLNLKILELEKSLSASFDANTRVEALQKDLNSSQDIIQSLREQLQSLADSDIIIEHLTTENEELQNTVKELTQSVQEFTELHQLEKSIEDDQYEFETKFKLEIEKLSRDVDQKRLEILRLQSINEKLTADHEAMYNAMMKSRDSENEMELMRLELKRSRAKVLKLDLTHSFHEEYNKATTRLQTQLINGKFKQHFYVILQLNRITCYCLVLISHIIELKQGSFTLEYSSLLRRLHCAALYILQRLQHDVDGNINSVTMGNHVTGAVQGIESVMKQIQDGDFDNLNLAFVTPFIEETNTMLPLDEAKNIDRAISHISMSKDELESCKLTLKFAQIQHLRLVPESESDFLLEKRVSGLIDSLKEQLMTSLDELKKSKFDLITKVKIPISQLSALNDRLIMHLHSYEQKSNPESFDIAEQFQLWRGVVDALEISLQDISLGLPSNLSFDKEKLGSIYSPEMPGKSQAVNYPRDDYSSLQSNILEKEQNLKDLSMQLEIFESNSNLSLNSKQRELEAVQKRNNELENDLEDLSKQLAFHVKENSLLVEELDSRGQHDLDSMFIQAPSLHSLQDKRNHVNNSVLIDEIKVLRQITRLSISTGKAGDYDWLKVPLIRRKNEDAKSNSPFLSLARKRKREVLALSKQNHSIKY